MLLMCFSPECHKGVLPEEPRRKINCIILKDISAPVSHDGNAGGSVETTRILMAAFYLVITTSWWPIQYYEGFPYLYYAPQLVSDTW